MEEEEEGGRFGVVEGTKGRRKDGGRRRMGRGKMG